MKLIHRVGAPLGVAHQIPAIFTSVGMVVKAAGHVRRFLSALNWKGGVSVWYELIPIDNDAPPRAVGNFVTLWAVPTGMIVGYLPPEATFIGTALFEPLGLVFHIYGLVETEGMFNYRHPDPATRPVPE